MCSLFTNMSVSRIPNNAVLKIDREGTGDVMSSKFEKDEINYDVEFKGTDIRLLFSQYHLEIVRWPTAEKQDDDMYNNKHSKKTCVMNLLKSFLEETQKTKIAIETMPPPPLELSDLFCKIFLGDWKSDG